MLTIFAAGAGQDSNLSAFGDQGFALRLSAHSSLFLLV